MIEKTIETGQRSDDTMSYEEAVFFIFCLGDGWRLPTLAEFRMQHGDELDTCWFQNDKLRLSGMRFYATPVRDLKDD